MDDLISRQAVLDLIADYDLSMGQVVKGIHNLPSATPQQKTGHWIGDKGATVYVNSEGNVTESVNCSECGEWLTGSDEYVCGARYCPSCGIKMEEKK